MFTLLFEMRSASHPCSSGDGDVKSLPNQEWAHCGVLMGQAPTNVPPCFQAMLMIVPNGS